MDEPDSKIKSALHTAHENFRNNDSQNAKKVLEECKMVHIAIELNTLLCEYRQEPKNATHILKKMMDILTKINIQLYQERPKQSKAITKKAPLPTLTHEFYYWNIIVLAQQLSKHQISFLLCNEALYFSDRMRTQTVLMIIYQMVKYMESENRLASCIALVEKQNKVIGHVKNLGRVQQNYRQMNQLLFTKIIIKLGMIEGGKIMYMMKFNQNEDDDSDFKNDQCNVIPFKIYQEFLHSQIEFYSKNYSMSQKLNSQILSLSDNLKSRQKQLIKTMIDNNKGLAMCLNNNCTVGRWLINRSMTNMMNMKESKDSKEVKDNEKTLQINQSKENSMMANLMDVKSYRLLYEGLRHYENSYSFKINYRKAQICVEYYHQMLKNPEKSLSWKNINDFYETTYYYPNEPYFQQKLKNKNPNYTNGKFFYRRYELPAWNQKLHDDEEKQENKDEANGKNEIKNQIKEPSKDKKKQKANKGKKTKKEENEVEKNQEKKEVKKEVKIDEENEAFKKHLKNVLDESEHYLKKALIILENEKKVIVNMEGSQKQLTHQVNEKLYSQYTEYKGSIYNLLCYVFLCKNEWSKVIYYATQYKKSQKIFSNLNEKKSVRHRQFYYNILSYEAEAYCELNKIQNSYESMHSIINSVGYSEEIKIMARSTTSQNQGETYFESMTQYISFCYNISVIHSRDNKIPQTHQAIQKMLHHMGISPSNPQAILPMSTIDLLIHYNLRTLNYSSALQLIKRRRILPNGVMAGGNQILNVTK